MASVIKQNKFFFYVKGYGQRFLPVGNLEQTILDLYKNISPSEKNEVEFRVDYYHKLNEKQSISKDGTRVLDLLHPKTPKAYYFDTYEFARYFPKNDRIDFEFGDVNYLLETPSICKSRPIFGKNENNILLNLDKARHFVCVKDEKSFAEKKDLLIGRAAIYQKHRVDFYEKNFENSLCDLGQVNKIGGNANWIKPKLSLIEHLDYKFILSLEGNDVATNLKWIMSSNSIAVSPPLKMETWYMEGLLKPDEHFVCINDFEKLKEKLQYYIDHPKESEEIIKNAKLHREKFNNENVEKLISLLVLKKYFAYIRI
jgi:hypothetical protein